MSDALPHRPVAAAPSQRDPRLDVLRGIALVMIFINHVPGNIYENFTSRNFGFSDAAEGFVLMAGISAGLAYSSDFRLRMPWRGLGRVWNRAWLLYLVHLMITFAALGIAAGLAVWADMPAMLWKHGIGTLFNNPLGFLIGVPTLGLQLGYANILPLYFVLLMAAPPLIYLGCRKPMWLLAGSVVLWGVTAHYRVNLPQYPGNGGWQFSPLAWQLLFVVGLVTGIAAKQGRALVPQRRWLKLLAVGMLLMSLVWMSWPAFGAVGRHQLWLANQFGLSGVFTGFSKPYLSVPRLLHVLALFYVLASFGWVRRAAASRIAAPFALLGRQSLPVFALGSVLAYLLQGIKTETGNDPLLDSLMLGGCIALQLALASAKHYWPSGRPAIAGATPAPARSEIAAATEPSASAA